MKNVFKVLISACVMFGVAGCGFQIGPAYPERDGRAFLEQKGYAPSVVETVITRGVLTRQQIVEFSTSKSADVRFLVASNPNLGEFDIELFMSDPNDYARSGTAYNPNLSPEQIAKLFRDPSHTVYCGLARNPSVPTNTLLRLHEERNPGLLYFAMNPNCPDVLKEQIRKSGDALANHWLNWTEERKRNEPNASILP